MTNKKLFHVHGFMVVDQNLSEKEIKSALNKKLENARILRIDIGKRSIKIENWNRRTGKRIDVGWAGYISKDLNKQWKLPLSNRQRTKGSKNNKLKGNDTTKVYRRISASNDIKKLASDRRKAREKKTQRIWWGNCRN